MSDTAKQRAAYHEAGHIVIIYLCAPNKDISRATLFSPESNSGSTWISDKQKAQALDRFSLITELKVSLAGYMCEKMKFGTASNNV
jgi:ATP-dependent Zn protease